MRVQYQLTSDDFWQSTLVWRNARGWRKWSFRVLPPLCVLLLMLSALGLWQSPQYRTSLPLLILGAFYVLFIWAAPRLKARRRASLSTTRSAQTLEISDRGLHFLSAVEDSQVSWSAFAGWREGNSVIALFPSAQSSLPVPKRAFTEQQLAEFREMLRRNIVAK
jgi:YcxB-like protein